MINIKLHSNVGVAIVYGIGKVNILELSNKKSATIHNYICIYYLLFYLYSSPQIETVKPMFSTCWVLSSIRPTYKLRRTAADDWRVVRVGSS